MLKSIIQFKIIIVLVLIQTGISFSQTTGYAGKKWIIKTDFLNGKYMGFNNVEVERVISRQLSVTLGARHLKEYYKQQYNLGELRNYVHDRLSLGYSNNNLNLRETIVESKLVYINGKYYFDRIIPAPSKNYVFFNWIHGRAEIPVGLYVLDVDENVIKSYWEIDFYDNHSNYLIYDVYTEKNILTNQFELGYGYQYIHRGIFTIDSMLGLNLTFFNARGDIESQRKTSGVARQYGPNLTSLGKKNSEYKNNPFYDNFGFLFYLKIGYLLF